VLLLYLLYQYTLMSRVDRYTGYIQYTGICLDTGIGDIDNLKIPIYQYFGILLPNTELKRYFKSNLLTITFRKQS
jgi:hypothetical protein